MLGNSVRRLLASCDAVALTTESPHGRPVLRLSVRTWLGHDAIAAAIDVLVTVSAGLRDAYASIDATGLRAAGSPYRPQLDDAQVDALRSALADEVAFVARVRDKR
jgi:hypothetical protein